MIDSANKLQRTFNNYQVAMKDFQKKLNQSKAKVTTAEVKAFLAAIKRAKEEHRKEVKNFVAQKSSDAKLAQNTANAIRNFLANLAMYKGVIETAAIHVLHELEDELDKEEKLLQEEARNEYNTVGEVEEGGLDSHQ